ncbi:hypothetical protein VTO42DRAFT_2617 [Malbranchea cinnamomea]
MARAHIGYLVGYESTNVFRIWVPYLHRVFRSRDVRFDETRCYDPTEPHIAQQLREHIEDLIETIHIPETCPFNSLPLQGETTTKTPTDSVRDTEAKRTSATQEYLPTPEPTPEPMLKTVDVAPTDPIDEPASVPGHADPTYNASYNDIEGLDSSDFDPAMQLALDLDTFIDTNPPREGENLTSMSMPGSFNFNDPIPRTNVAPRHNEISADFSEDNIIEGKRKRKPSSRVLGIFNTILQSAFSANLEPGKKAIHRSNLPPAPRTWREMQKHKFRDYWFRAARIEVGKLEERGTYKIVPTPYGKQLLPLMWVFSYKFDDEGFLLKFKARLVIRGDLVKANGKNTRSDTLAACTAQALIAIMSYFDLDTRHYDGVNVFLNSYLDADEQVYCLHPEGFARPGTTIIFFYVDDIVILNRKEHRKDADEVVTALRTKYELRDMGNLEWFLNIRITRDRPNHRTWLTQDSYIDKIVKEFGLSDDIKVRTPLSRDSSAYRAYEGVASNEDVHYYQCRIGSLIYPAFMTRPDIAHAASLLARFMTNPSPFHSSEADRLICYLRDTKDLSVCFSATEASGAMIKVWEGASDAAYTDDKDTRRSFEGYLFKLFSGPIDWKAIRQSTITTSTTEAELLAATHARKEIMAWHRFFKQLGFDPGQDLNLYCDNRMVTGILDKTSPVISTKLHYIDIHQHWFRERVQEGTLQVEWILTTQMPADGLMKPLSSVQKHERFVELLGLKRCGLY